MTNKEAIEILTNVKNTPQITWTNGADIALDLAIKALKERPQGEWVEAEITEEYRQYGFDLRVVCSRCGSEQSYFDFNEYHEPIAVTYIRSRFCPYCGAKMIKDFTGEAIP